MSEQTMWAVKGADGIIDKATVRATERESINAFLPNQGICRWVRYVDHGYRCVRVRITEVQDGA
jgi:hypothetical protein